jgi:DNA-binding HxlR family transcriptional regulator
VVPFCLSGGVRRFNELQHHIPDISKKMLIQVLRRLDGDSGEAERSLRREAERHSGIIPNTIGA